MTVTLKRSTCIIAGILASFFYVTPFVSASEYSRPLANLPTEDKFEFKIGENVFQKFWVPSPSSTTASDGLGPLFNTRSCNNCHVNNGRGHAPEAGINGASVPSFLIKIGKHYPNNSQGLHINNEPILPMTGDKNYGHQLQGHSVQGIQPEGDFTLSYDIKIVTLDDGTQVELRKPRLHWLELHYGELEPSSRITMMVSPPLVGMGLLDNIPEDNILANADPLDSNQDGISGRPNWIISKGEKILGRFGYKATSPSLTDQNQSAFNTDLGLSTPLHSAPSGDCTEQQVACIKSPNGNSAHLGNLEADEQQVRLVDFFVALSSPPAIRNLKDPDFLAGKKVFDQAKCATCHIPKMETRKNATFPLLSDRSFYPFTDMLLHDMGPELASGFPIFSAQASEWRTAPLWGIGLSEKVSGRTGFLHDGRARTIEEAILWHGGEAEKSQRFYKSLDKKSREQFIYFLESL